MSPPSVSESASNWVDRGEPAEPTLMRILSHFLERPSTVASADLAEHAGTIVGMVEADATEVHLVGYLRDVRRDLQLPEVDARYARAVAIALWHVAKVAQWRKRALREAAAAVGDGSAASRPLGEWLADRLLTPDELEQHRQVRDSPSGPPKRRRRN